MDHFEWPIDDDNLLQYNALSTTKLVAYFKLEKYLAFSSSDNGLGIEQKFINWQV